MSDWIAIYDAPSDSEPPFECLVAGKVVTNCIWVTSPVEQYMRLTDSIARPLDYGPTHWRPAQREDKPT